MKIFVQYFSEFSGKHILLSEKFPFHCNLTTQSLLEYFKKLEKKLQKLFRHRKMIFSSKYRKGFFLNYSFQCLYNPIFWAQNSFKHQIRDSMVFENPIDRQGDKISDVLCFRYPQPLPQIDHWDFFHQLPNRQF